MQTRVITAHLPIELAKRVAQASERLERSRGWIVQKALAEWLRREEERRRLTLEALADVDEGRVLDQHEMETWAGGLGARKGRRR